MWACVGMGLHAVVAIGDMRPPKHLILWDGACGLCAASVQWVKSRDPQGIFAAVPYSLLPPEVQKRISVQALSRSIHVITAEGQVLRGGQAVLFIGEKLGYCPALLRWLRLRPFVWGVEMAYWVVARLRRPLSRACGLKPPTPLPGAGPPANAAPTAQETSAWCGTSEDAQANPPAQPAQ